MPLDSNLVNAARAAHQAGRLVDAERLARQALVGSPSDVELRALLGVVLAKQFKLAEAGPLLSAVAEADPGNYESRLWLSRLARKAGRAEDSAAYAEAALALAPGSAEALINYGLALIDIRQFGAAAGALSRAAQASPDSAGIFLHLGIAQLNEGNLPEAHAAFSQAVELDPRLSDAHLGLGQVLLAAADLSGAAGAATKAIELNPKNKPAHHLLLETLIEANRPGEAERHARMFLAANPGDATGLALLGRCLLSVGKSEEGVRALEESLGARPLQGTAYCLIAQSRKLGAADEGFVARMEAAAKESLPPTEESYLRYGIGKAYEDLGRHAEAMAQFDRANEIAYRQKFGSAVMDQRAYAAQVQWAISTFGADFLAEHAGIGDPSEVPVFIVGMIRSGTTLVEQILSSHPRVGAGGEQRFWQAHWQDAFGPSGELDGERLRSLAATYLTVLGRLELGTERVIDKLPGNYTRLGLLHLAFPNARFIHTRRNPVDTCLSIWTTPNSAPNEFTHDKANIVFGYREYQRLMAHWRAVLGGSVFLEVDYEELISDRERVTRAMVEFCGLEWDPACLRPEDSQRAIFTPSAVQARQPVYATSVGRRERYRGLLGEFEELG